MVENPTKIYGNDLTNMRQSLGRMVQQSYIDCNCNRGEAAQLMKEWLTHDRRFDSFDKERLVAKVEEVGMSGGHLDLSDPYLHGGARRPLYDR
jgi:hypothetical protein